MSNETETRIIKELIGKTFNHVINNGDYELIFIGSSSYKFHHEQDCCESVNIEDICGDLSDLENSPIIQAEETSKCGNTEYGSETWTFYRISTAKGGVVIRWLGESNGYYSESVYFDPISQDEAWSHKLKTTRLHKAIYR
jgi:hypothetical protein